MPAWIRRRLFVGATLHVPARVPDSNRDGNDHGAVRGRARARILEITAFAILNKFRIGTVAPVVHTSGACQLKSEPHRKA